MKSLTLLALLVFAAAGVPTFALAAEERADVLRAINWVENPSNHSRRGAHGELGPYQFMAQTWRLHTRKPFHLAVVREHADEIAVKHYEWLCKGLRDAGIDPNPYNVALAWNSGLGAVTSGRVPMITYNYAERVHNLVDAQRAQRIAANRRDGLIVAVASAISTAEVRFTLEPNAPRFVLVTEPLYEPIVVTDKTPVSTRAVAQADKPAFTLSPAPTFAFVVP
jgi:hypothetical protein